MVAEKFERQVITMEFELKNLSIKIDKLTDITNQNSKDIAVIDNHLKHKKCPYENKMKDIDQHLQEGNIFRERQKESEMRILALDNMCTEIKSNFSCLNKSFSKLYWSIVGTIIAMFGAFITAIIRIAEMGGR